MGHLSRHLNFEGGRAAAGRVIPMCESRVHGCHKTQISVTHTQSFFFFRQNLLANSVHHSLKMPHQRSTLSIVLQQYLHKNGIDLKTAGLRAMSRFSVLLLICSLVGTTTAFVTPSVGGGSSPIHQSPSKRYVPSHDQENFFLRQRGHTTTSSKQQTTKLAAALLPTGKFTAIGMGIGKFYKASPLIACFLTASTKACFADTMAQYRDTTTTKFDIRRNLAMILYSGTILGLVCSVMYNQLFPILFAGETNPLVLAIKMALFDGFINAPLIWLPPAYIAKALIYNQPKRKALQKYIIDVKENGLLKKYWALWLPASLANFMFIPAHFRVAFVAAVSFFWMILLSIVANNNNEDVEGIVESGCEI